MIFDMRPSKFVLGCLESRWRFWYILVFSIHSSSETEIDKQEKLSFVNKSAEPDISIKDRWEIFRNLF